MSPIGHPRSDIPDRTSPIGHPRSDPHSSRVRERSELLARAIEKWHAMPIDDRTTASHKKLMRLADDLLRAMVKEKKAYLDRTTLDRQSAEFKSKLAEIEQLQIAGAPYILKTMGLVDGIDSP